MDPARDAKPDNGLLDVVFLPTHLSPGRCCGRRVLKGGGGGSSGRGGGLVLDFTMRLKMASIGRRRGRLQDEVDITCSSGCGGVPSLTGSTGSV